VWEARRRGALFDIGFGANNFSFVVAERAVAQDMIPDLISSDLQQFNVLGPVYSLAHVASVFLRLDLSLAEVIERITIAPARALGLDDRAGSLRPGLPADVTVLRLEEGDFEFADCYDNTRKAKGRLVPVMAFKRGVRHDCDLLSCQNERNWHTQIAEDHVPAAAARLSGEERRFLSALARDLECVAWNGDVIDLHCATEVQRRFHAVREARGLPLKIALTAVYDSFLDDPFTYQIGLFLTRMNRDFVLNRLNEIGADAAVPAH
jgi:dihydroorotase